jgi:hypothetical protein
MMLLMLSTFLLANYIVLAAVGDEGEGGTAAGAEGAAANDTAPAEEEAAAPK